MTTPAVFANDYEQALREFSWDRMWSLVSGNPDRLNIGYECLDRHPRDRTALRICYDDGRAETFDFGLLSDRSAQWAHVLHKRGVRQGDRVALLVQPSLHFYAGLFGILKLGAVAVPLYPLFGPDGLRLRLEYANPRYVVVADPQLRRLVPDPLAALAIDERSSPTWSAAAGACTPPAPTSGCGRSPPR